MIIETLFYTFLILCLGYGIKETLEHWDNEQD
jgi:hypothetical protein